jgi:urocanate hydratase
VGVFKTHPDAPRVLIANSNLVPRWATWEHFNELDRKGLMMFGQMTRGSWIYIGSQGIVQGTYETFAEAGRQHFGGDLSDKWILTAGLGGMGGAQPLAATMAGASMLAIECQASRIAMRLRTPLPRRAGGRPRPRARADRAGRTDRKPVSVGSSATRRTVLPSSRGATCARTWSRTRRPRTTSCTATCLRVDRRALASGARRQHAARGARRGGETIDRDARGAMLHFHAQGIPRSTTATTSARSRYDEGVGDAFAFPGFVPAYIRPLFCEARARFDGSRSPAIRTTSARRIAR